MSKKRKVIPLNTNSFPAKLLESDSNSIHLVSLAVSQETELCICVILLKVVFFCCCLFAVRC